MTVETEGSEFQLSIGYRPQTIEDFLASEATKTHVNSIINSKRSLAAVLLSGMTGCGKTTLAKIIAYAINGIPYGEPTMDIHYVNVGDKRGVDEMRGLSVIYNRLPQHKKTIIILDEAHMLTGQAASAVLTPLEEPRKHRMFILCTNEPERLLTTLVNRCIPLHLEPPDPKDLAKYLRGILKKEKALTKDSDDDKKVLTKAIVEAAGGIPRASLQLLESVMDSRGEYKSIKDLIKGPLLKTPVLQMDQAAVKIIIGLCKLHAVGQSSASAGDRGKKLSEIMKTLVETMEGLDGFTLIGRLAIYIEAITREIIGGLRVPSAYPLKKAASEFKVSLEPDAIIALLDKIVPLKDKAGQFQVSASLLLLQFVLSCGAEFVDPKK